MVADALGLLIGEFPKEKAAEESLLLAANGVLEGVRRATRPPGAAPG